MTTRPRLRIAPPPAITTGEPKPDPLRLKLKPEAPPTGYVDGAWWPRTRNLAAELPALLAVLAARLGAIQRVSYNIAAWDVPPRHIDVSGQQVRLGGFHSQDAHSVDVIARDRPHLTLLVVPPDTAAATAHHVLMTAATSNNADSITELLSPR
jgi:hypothetical protein